jgi:DUF1680 family protein
LPTTEPTKRGGPVHPSTSRIRPLGPEQISIVGGFWHEKQQLNADVILGHCETWMERIGWTSNFDRAAAGTIAGNHVGIEFVDSEIYKLLEAMAWELGRNENVALGERFAALVARVGAAQEPDGYVHTSFGRAGQPPRYSDLEFGHELYCFGHLLQAAVARLRSGNDDQLPAIARKLADHLYEEFGPLGTVAVCGHPEIEVALAEFSRATGDGRYLELATLFVDRRGHGLLNPVTFGAEYFQDDEPVREATVLRGHAVRALYLSAGAVDVGVENTDGGLVDAVRTQWANTVARRTYVTGGMGSHHLDESFGADYELPPDRAYSETCAGVASVMLSWRLLLETGSSEYADVIERTLFNAILVSPREDGRAFYYSNTLHQRDCGSVPPENEVSARAESSLRAPWFEVSCCPTNVARTLASVGLYFATETDEGVQLHQYGDYDVTTELPSGTLRLGVRSGYPFDGAVVVSVHEAPEAGAIVSLRVPAWASGATLDGRTVPVGGMVTVSVHSGCVIRLQLPMAPRVVHPHPYIDATRGTVAIERGPLVLALESTDLPNQADVAGAVFDATAPLEPTEHGARAAVRLEIATESSWPYGSGEEQSSLPTTAVELIPYFSWANRGPSTMRVWLPLARPAD